MRILIVGLCLIACTLAVSINYHPLDDSFIEAINSAQNGWTAGRNFPRDTPISTLRGMCGVKKDPTGFRLRTRDAAELPTNPLPDHYDAREVYPNCPTIGQPRDQGPCGSCWAFGAVESMTDRFCIHSKDSYQFIVSPEDLVSCCTNCGDGCYGGYPHRAWDYWVKNGIVSGGGYDSNQGCYPYELPPCGVPPNQPFPGYCKYIHPTPPCIKRCESSYNSTFRHDLRFGVDAYIVDSSVHAIQQEIYQNGPVEAAFDVYQDFMNYKNGVYKHVEGGFMGGHAVKIIGWGIEDGQDYWLIANSWGKYWGLQGFFKILRGVNECGIEENIRAGLPREPRN